MRPDKGVLFAIVLSIVASLSAPAESPGDFPCIRPMRGVAESGWHEAVLNDSVYRYAAPGLADLRIFDAEGRAIPFALAAAQPETTRERSRFPLTLTYAGLAKKTRFIEYQCLAEGEVRANRLEFSADSREFSRRIRILGRGLSSDWQSIVSDTIYRLGDREKLAVDFGGEVTYLFYRVEIDADTPPAGIAALSLLLDAETVSWKALTRDVVLSFSRAEEKGRTLITVKNPFHLELLRLDVDADGSFRRYATVGVARSELGSAMLFRFGSGQDEISDLEIPLRSGTREESLELRIENGDSPPLTIKGLVARCRSDRILFEARGKTPYTLRYGNPDAVKPSYDVASFTNRILGEKRLPVSLDPQSGLPVTPSPTKPGFSLSPLAFNSIVIAVAASLAILLVVVFLRKKD